MPGEPRESARATDGDPAPESVISRLLGPGSQVGLVRLPQADDETSAPAPAGEARGRYRLSGEIARGGVGVVLRGHDPDLGRDVAIKVLRSEFAGDRDVLQRFVEEAQIGGQLQHPGIVPVYELGASHDGQPFFAMKLIKGQTLQSLLAERQDPGVDRQRWLTVFQAVCQAVAYAHSRGVIHRDLKPANVMVGPYGEVLVVDWGLAKVLRDAEGRRHTSPRSPPSSTVVATRRSEDPAAASECGALLGTANYMAPEQARGEIDDVDEQSDVFGLGGILCQVLTGHPPYRGTGVTAILAAQQAAQGEVHERLEACGADRRLVDLARSCLAPRKADRPASAAAVAETVGAYRADLERTARLAEQAALEARARAEAEGIRAAGERRARRLTLALALAFGALVSLGGGGWLWWEAQRRDRQRRVERSVATDLRVAAEARLRARDSPDDAVVPLEQGLAAARHAERVAMSPDGTAEARAQAREAVQALAGALEEAKSRAANRTRDLAILARLEEIGLRWGDSLRADVAAEEYAAAFRSFFGADLDALDERDVALRLDRSPVRTEILAALDGWLLARQSAGRPPGGVERAVERLAPDPWRPRIAAARGDLQALRTLADEALAQGTLAPSQAVTLGSYLEWAGDPDRAADVSLAVWRAHPSDYWACFHCAFRMSAARPPRLTEALRFYTAAIALRPTSSAAHNNLGGVLKDLGDLDQALAAYDEAIRLEPGRGDYRANRGNILRERGDLAAAEAAYREALRLDPERASGYRGLASLARSRGDLAAELELRREAVRREPGNASVRSELGTAHHLRGEFREAAAAHREAVLLAPGWAPAHIHLSLALLEAGDRTGARAAAEEAFRLAPWDARAQTQVGLVLEAEGDLRGALERHREALRLRPDTAEFLANAGSVLRRLREYEESGRLLRRAVEVEPGHAMAHMALGNLRFDQGDYRGAVAAHLQAVTLAPRTGKAWANLGSAQHAAGDARAAIVSLREAVRLSPNDPLGVRNLAVVLWAEGEIADAVPVLRHARRLAPDDEAIAERLQRARRLARALRRVPGALAGTHPPESASEGVAMAEALSLRSEFVRSARLYEATLARWPEAGEDPERCVRCDAALAAARAGTGQGKDAGDLPESERSRWRGRSLAWLEAERSEREARKAKEPAREESIRRSLAAWLLDPSWEPVRGEGALSLLPSEEQGAWRQFWQRVAENR